MTISRQNPATKAAKLALLFISIVVVQGILAYRFAIFRYIDLPLIYCIYYGFTRARPVAAVATGSVLGLMQDSLSGVALGTNGFSKTLVAFLAASSGSKFDVDQTITRVIALILFTILDSMLKVLAGVITEAGPGALLLLNPGQIALSAVCNTLLGLILFGFRGRPYDATA